MRLLVAAIGRMKSGPERELAARYRERASRAGRAIGFRGIDVAEIDESRARSAPQRVAEEGAALAAALPENAAIVVLDGGGDSLSSTQIAQRLQRWRDQGHPVTTFLIGGPDGLADPLKGRADLSLAFGRATWPHQLARIMLLEQLYRAMTVLSGHPYHRA